MLLDAVALHENLYILKGELTKEAQSLELRNVLLAKEIVREMDTIPFCDVITQELNEYFGRILEAKGWSRERRDLHRALVEAIHIFLGDGKECEDHFKNLTNSKVEMRDWCIDLAIFKLKRLDEEFTLIDTFDEKNVDNIHSDPILFLGKRLVREFNRDSTGEYGPYISEVPLLRTFLYWRISEHAKINLYPSSRRIAEIGLLTNHVRKSVARDVAKIMADAFKNSVEVAYFAEPNIPLVLPPTLVIFLDCYRSTRNISAAIDEFRGIFAKTRAVFFEAEQDLASATSIAKRQKIKKRISKSLRLLKTKYDRSDDAFLEALVGFAPEVLKPLSNPLDPTKYSTQLLLKPAEWIWNWWISRPLRHVCSIQKRLVNIMRYETLIQDTLGIKVNPSESLQILERYHEYFELKGKGTQ